MRKRSKFKGYLGKRKTARWRILNERDSDGKFVLYETIEEAREAGATRFTPQFSRE